MAILALIPAAVSLFGAFVAIVYYYKNLKLSQHVADRTVTVEAQKLLLEVNKQFVSDPDLLAIYDDHPNRETLLRDKLGLREKIEALGYMNLNVFEIVFAVLPMGSQATTWVSYFQDSLKRCAVIRDELDRRPEIYDPSLIAQYRRWQTSQKTKS